MALNGLIHEEEHEDEEEEEEEEEVSALEDERAMGWWGAGELRLSQSWLVGGRLDRVQNPGGHRPDGMGHVAHAHLVAERVCPIAP